MSTMWCVDYTHMMRLFRSLLSRKCLIVLHVSVHNVNWLLVFI